MCFRVYSETTGMHARSACFFLLTLMMSSGGCALLSGVGDYDVVDDEQDRSQQGPDANIVSNDASSTTIRDAADTTLPDQDASAGDSAGPPPALCDVNDTSLIMAGRRPKSRPHRRDGSANSRQFRP